MLVMFCVGNSNCTSLSRSEALILNHFLFRWSLSVLTSTAHTHNNKHIHKELAVCMSACLYRGLHHVTIADSSS